MCRYMENHNNKHGGRPVPIHRPMVRRVLEMRKRTRKHCRVYQCEFCGVKRRDMAHHLAKHHPGRLTAGEIRMAEIVCEVCTKLAAYRAGHIGLWEREK